MVTSKIGRSGTDRIRWGDRSDAGNGGEAQHVDGVRPLLSTRSPSSDAVPGGIERALWTGYPRGHGAPQSAAAPWRTGTPVAALSTGPIGPCGLPLRLQVPRARCKLRLHVEAELDHVAVGHRVVLALDPGLPASAGLGDRAALDQVGVGDDLGLDEATLEVGVDHAGSLRSRPAPVDGPGSELLRPRGEERLQT